MDEIGERRGVIRGKTKREWEEIVAGIDKLGQAKEEKDGLGAVREAERKEPQEVVKH